jgi:hypothetical protein
MNLLALLPFLGDLLNRVLPDPAAKAEAQMKLALMVQNGELAALAAETDLAKGQIATNQAEAASTRLFVAGWRPFIGWICGAALAFDTLAKPMVVMVMAYAGHPAPAMPDLTDNQLYGLLFGLLGLGGLRTVEKVKGKS